MPETAQGLQACHWKGLESLLRPCREIRWVPLPLPDLEGCGSVSTRCCTTWQTALACFCAFLLACLLQRTPVRVPGNVMVTQRLRWLLTKVRMQPRLDVLVEIRLHFQRQIGQLVFEIRLYKAPRLLRRCL